MDERATEFEKDIYHKANVYDYKCYDHKAKQRGEKVNPVEYKPRILNAINQTFNDGLYKKMRYDENIQLAMSCNGFITKNEYDNPTKYINPDEPNYTYLVTFYIGYETRTDKKFGVEIVLEYENKKIDIYKSHTLMLPAFEIDLGYNTNIYLPRLTGMELQHILLSMKSSLDGKLGYETPLKKAIKEDDLDTFKKLVLDLDEKVWLKALETVICTKASKRLFWFIMGVVDPDCTTATRLLSTACYHGNSLAIKTLLPLSNINYDMDSHFFSVIRSGDLASVQALSPYVKSWIDIKHCIKIAEGNTDIIRYFNDIGFRKHDRY
jgi:hypothetical protein